MKLNKSPSAMARARNMRGDMSVAEKWFWEVVRKDRLGHRFRRQVPIGPYFLVFYAPLCKVCVEIDGEQHSLTVDQDKRRDEFLANLGILTIRIPSLELANSELPSYEQWIVEVKRLCDERAPTKS